MGILGAVSVVPARASIQFGENNYTAPFAASTTEQVGGLVQDLNIPDISNMNTVNSIRTGTGVIMGIGNFFSDLNEWLMVKAGINLFGILTTIGHWFIFTLEWILKGLKAVL